MAYTSIYKDVLFIEGEEPTAKILGTVEYEKNFTFNAQLKTLDSVKDQLAEKAVAMGGNAVINFEYGQKSLGWFKASLFSLDDNIKWHGKGIAAVIPEERKNEILEKLRKL